MEDDLLSSSNCGLLELGARRDLVAWTRTVSATMHRVREALADLPATPLVRRQDDQFFDDLGRFVDAITSATLTQATIVVNYAVPPSAARLASLDETALLRVAALFFAHAVATSRRAQGERREQWLSAAARIYGEDDLYVSAWSAMLEFDEEGADAAALVAFSDLLGLSEVDLRTRDAFRDFGRQAPSSALLRSH